MKRIARGIQAVGIVVLVLAGITSAHDQDTIRRVVIDTDMGLDDAVTLAMALQSPYMEVESVIACPSGVADGEQCTEFLERMLTFFNRKDVRLYEAASMEKVPEAPPFRSFAGSAVDQALPKSVEPFHKPFSPSAFSVADRKVAVLALGPLTNIAAAIEADPEIRKGIEMIMIPGTVGPEKNWNLKRDPDAVRAVMESGIPVWFASPGKLGLKDPQWVKEGFSAGRNTSPAARFLARLFADEKVRKHYFGEWKQFYDEVGFVALAHPDGFTWRVVGQFPVVEPETEPYVMNQTILDSIRYGRQKKWRVIFRDRPLSQGLFQSDVQSRMDGILEKNGKDEWFSQLIMNELHDHLGAYSIVGVKMGLRAAELLNAPPHSMRVVSHAPAVPPSSCMNDGLIVSTGSTPGRALFVHEPGEKGSTEVLFSYNGRTLKLSLKPEYREKIAQRIRTLVGKYGLEDPRYWDGVRAFGLTIWEDWHRADLFDIEVVGEVRGA